MKKCRNSLICRICFWIVIILGDLIVGLNSTAVKHIKEDYGDVIREMTHTALFLPGYDLCADGANHAAEFASQAFYERPNLFNTTSNFVVLAHSGKQWVDARDFELGIVLQDGLPLDRISEYQKQQSLDLETPKIWSTRIKVDTPLKLGYSLEYRKPARALSASDCSTQAMPIGDLAREWKLPLFTSVAGDTRLTNKERYSTTSAIASLAGPDVIATIHSLLKRFNWRTVTIMCDSLSQAPGLSNFFVIQCSDAKRLLAAEHYTWYSADFDTQKPVDFLGYLLDAKSRCRILIILTLPVFLRKIMLEADKLGMTHGDYVYVTLQPTTRPGMLPIIWNDSFGDPNGRNVTLENEVIFQAFQNLIILTGVNPDWEAIKDLTDEITETKRALFNMSTAHGDEKNELQICIYESTLMFAQIFVENYPQVLTMNTSKFVSKTFSRVYNFAARNFSTDGSGAMISYIVVLRLDIASRKTKVAMIHNPVTKGFENVDLSLWYWPLGDGPPPDRPKCGFANNECLDADSASAVTLAVVLTVVAVLIIVGAGAIYYVIRRRYGLASLWWLLDFGSVTYHPYKNLKEKDDFSSTEEQLIGTRMYFRYQDVYALTIIINDDAQFPVLASTHRVRLLMYNLHQMRHENVAAFAGLCNSGTLIMVVSEYCSKGNLRRLLSFGSGNFMDEGHLERSLAWDLFEGLDYLHRTSYAGPHGNLNSFVCLVDARFTLKIAQAGYDKLFEALHADRDASVRSTIMAIQLLWKSPEFVHGRDDDPKTQKPRVTKESDLYSLAMIFYEIFTQRMPHDMLSFSPENVKATLGKVMYEGGFQITTIDPLVPLSLRGLLNECLGRPEKRPTAAVFRNKLQRVIRRPKTYFMQIAKQLEAQARKLEDIVEKRTVVLQREMEYADLLLQEILPLPIVKKLRNNESVEPESFDAVTLLFSDLPVFAQLAAFCTPVEIIDLLNKIYSLFDTVIAGHDVYKIETISDTYMIGSGVPIRNGPDHAPSICDLSVEMLRVSRFIPNPGPHIEPVEIRIGINTGPVVAGVIGRRMPRYCLFGDTVNTTSRMESHGEGEPPMFSVCRIRAGAGS